jgi:rSAM/selenodomain-associated transferase 2
MKISAVVPTLNAAHHLPACLEALSAADEVVVADGGSSDATQAIARSGGARLVEGPPGRGLQLAAGAAAARGDVLVFVHADTRLSAEWVELVRIHAAQSSLPACFRLRLDDPAWQARIIEHGVAVRTRLLGLPYGDQGLVIRRDAYERSGGFRPLPLMEDVDLLRRTGRPIMFNADALTSAERWRKDGWLRRSSRNLACLALWKLGLSAHHVAALYDKPSPASPSLPGRGARAG